MPDEISIEFLTRSDLLEKFPKPYPAREALPSWYLQMEGETSPPSEFGTVKRCPPFLDALSAGYIIPVPVDVRITVTQSSIDIETREKFSQPMVALHDPRQFPGAPFPNRPVLKFHNPWIVKTPPSFSCFFVAPVNQFELPAIALSGIVDTDEYYTPVALPAVWMPGPGTQIVLSAGTPLVQVIPFRRENFTMQIGPWQDDREKQQHETINQNKHAYREMCWQKKKFT